MTIERQAVLDLFARNIRLSKWSLGDERLLQDTYREIRTLPESLPGIMSPDDDGDVRWMNANDLPEGWEWRQYPDGECWFSGRPFSVTTPNLIIIARPKPEPSIVVCFSLKSAENLLATPHGAAYNRKDIDNLCDAIRVAKGSEEGDYDYD